MPLLERPSGQSERWDDFSLMQGGPLYRLARAVGLPGGTSGFLYLGLSIALLAWVPLVVLAALGNTLTSGPTIPFVQSLGTHVRLLVTIPLLFASEALVDERARRVIRTLAATEVVPAGELPRLSAALLRAGQWRDTWIVEALLLVMSILLIWQGVRTDLPGAISTWRTTTSGERTLTGWWYGLGALPVFQFLLWRWCARLLIWTHVLWQIRRCDLQLIPTHPDRTGGIAAFGGVHAALAPLNLGVSAIIVASLAEQVLYGGADIRRVVLPVAVIVVGNTFLLVAPLLLFTPTLLQTKWRGSREYGGLAASYTRAFEMKWLRSRPPPAEPLLGSPDVQSLADLANVFDVIHHMRIVPIARNQLVFLAVAAALPAVPLIFLVIPLNELIIRGVRTILHM